MTFEIVLVNSRGSLQHLSEVLLFAAYMLAHLTAVVSIVFAENLATVAGILGDMVKVVLEVRKTFLEVITVRGAEVFGDEPVVDTRSLLVVGAIVVKSVNVAHRKEKMVVDTIVSADLLDGLFAKSQMYTKTRQHKD